jgi:hypothetical protein
MNTAAFRPGFRLSVVDVIVVLIGAVCSLLLDGMENPLGQTVLFTVAHFFLFCNVLRMRRSFELIWAALFVILASLSLSYNVPTWPSTVLIMLAVTLVLTVLQVRQPSYHGIFWQQLNPGLPQWWEEHVK